MSKYIKKFKKVVWGYIEVEADDIDEAEQKFADGEFDEKFDEKSEYEYGDWEYVIQDPAFDGR